MTIKSIVDSTKHKIFIMTVPVYTHTQSDFRGDSQTNQLLLAMLHETSFGSSHLILYVFP